MLGYLGNVVAQGVLYDEENPHDPWELKYDTTLQFQREFYEHGYAHDAWTQGSAKYRNGDKLEFKGWGRNPCTHALNIGWWGWSNSWNEQAADSAAYYYWSRRHDRTWENYAWDQSLRNDKITLEVKAWRDSGRVMPTQVPWYVNSVVFESDDFLYGQIGAYYDIPRDDESRTQDFFNCLTSQPYGIPVNEDFASHPNGTPYLYTMGWEREQNRINSGDISAHSIFSPAPWGYNANAYFEATRLSDTLYTYPNLSNFHKLARGWATVEGVKALQTGRFRRLGRWYQDWLKQYRGWVRGIFRLENKFGNLSQQAWQQKRVYVTQRLTKLLELASYYDKVQGVYSKADEHSKASWVTVSGVGVTPYQACQNVRDALFH